MVSIIIPVYNVAPYVEQCIQSVINQTYKNLEVIIVDDCGTDNSMEIVEKVVSQIPQNSQMTFKILHHEHNRGLSAARNTGIKAATGEYLYFLDSDDWIIPECIQLTMECVEKYPDVEMVIGRVKTNSQEPLPWLKFLPEGVYSEGFIEKTYYQDIFVMACNKLISKNYLKENELYFLEGINHEDVLWSMEVACKLSKVVAIKQYTYNYNIRPGSINTMESYCEFKKNCAKIKLSLLRYIYEYNCHNNKYLYKYINDSLYEYIIDGELIHVSFYKEFRKCNYWSPYKQKTFGAGKMILLLSLNRYMPLIIGYYYLKSILYMHNIVFKK